MKLTIIETGLVHPAIRDRFGDYPAMFRHIMSGAGTYTFETVSVVKGEALPEPGSLDGILFTGSASGVYDDEPWIGPLEDFIRAAAAAAVPQAGICFGHQILAEALGGKVVKSDRGWGAGRHTYRIVSCPPFIDEGCPASVSATASHQDQVVELPPGAQIVAASDFTPYAALYYPDAPALSFQCHPEFGDGFSAALYEALQPKLGEALAASAIASLQGPDDHARLAGWIAAFFDAHRRNR
ncbi:MAG TPA: gamma-glutamyl-gamma-aminobutyrate hydrolase family protein [Hyphomonas sp.]|nr:gamma-glutamyl-gamma-aminobutyrate hydrolase family protein [Hyphomonas sp.]HPE48498.1 gamma-glutamyl-gamma-aminobutyrate hydrolase family protein [Hyphomonas sp.]